MTFLSLLILTSLGHPTLRLKKLLRFRPSVFGDDCNQSMNSKHEWDFQWPASLRVGSSLRSTLSPSQPEYHGHRSHRGQGFCISPSESSPASCVQKQRYSVYNRSIHSHMRAQQQMGSHIYKLCEFHEPESWSHAFSTLNNLTQKESHES